MMAMGKLVEQLPLVCQVGEGCFCLSCLACASRSHILLLISRYNVFILFHASNDFPTKHNQSRHLAMLPRGDDLPGGGLPQADGPVPPLPPVLVLVDPMEREGDEALNERGGPSWGRLELSSCWGLIHYID